MFVEEAYKRAQDTPYKEAHEKVLNREESRDKISITVNPTELEILRCLVEYEITKQLQAMYDISHDDELSLQDMAFELAGSMLLEKRFQRLMSKLKKA